MSNAARDIRRKLRVLKHCEERGNVAKTCRLERGMSLKQLAKLLKLNESTIRKLEASRSKKPFQSTIAKITRYPIAHNIYGTASIK